MDILEYAWLKNHAGGGGGGTDANAVHYTAETKTDAQKQIARENIGAQKALDGNSTVTVGILTVDDALQVNAYSPLSLGREDFSQITNTGGIDLQEVLDGKQGILTAGTNITIEDGVISASGAAPDTTSIILDDNSKLAVKPDLTLNSLVSTNNINAVGNAIRLYKSTEGEKQPTVRINGALVMNSTQLENNIAEKGVALGYNCLIQNQAAFASGVGTAARGTASHAINKDNVAANQFSFASGINTVAAANMAFVSGNATIAKNANEAVFGMMNIVDNGETDPRLLVVGNGYEENKASFSVDELVGKYYDSGNKTADRYILITNDNKQAVKDNSSITKVQIRQNAFSVTKNGKITATTLSDGYYEKSITEVIEGALPPHTEFDEGAVLKIVDGQPTWTFD